jgi:hypothetical protein
MRTWFKISSKVVGYADDTSISCLSKNVPQLLESLESEVAKVLAYFAANKLVANAKKTMFLLIRGRNARKWPESAVSIGGGLVSESTVHSPQSTGGGSVAWTHRLLIRLDKILIYTINMALIWLKRLPDPK